MQGRDIDETTVMQFQSRFLITGAKPVLRMKQGSSPQRPSVHPGAQHRYLLAVFRLRSGQHEILGNRENHTFQDAACYASEVFFNLGQPKGKSVANRPAGMVPN